MPTETVARQKTVLLSVEDKLAVREAQLKFSNAKEAIHTAIANAQQADKNVIAVLTNLAQKLNLNIEDYVFNSDNLTFQHK
jgi:hypothetical protein